MQLYFPVNGATVPVNVLPEDVKPLSDSFVLAAGGSNTSDVSIFPHRCEALIVASKEPICVIVGDSSFDVGPEPLIWTRKANKGEPISSGEKRVDINTSTPGEKETTVLITAYHKCNS